MDNQIQSQNIGTKKKVGAIVTAVGVLLLSIGGWFIWQNYFSPDAQRQRQLQENIDKYTSAMKTFEDTMRADTYGGKTPQETLNMFIDALKKGDIALASKYFMLNTNTQSPDYLTRKKWEDALVETKNQGKLETIIEAALTAKPDPGSAISKDYFVFSAHDKNGILITDIDLYLNKYSGVWKITSI